MHKDENPLVSVIVPNYNNDAYLETCIESILSQTYKNIELIIIDDCSTDNSKKIIQKYEESYPNVKAIYLSKNRGVTLNRIHAINEAKGTYITTIDSDDYYYTDEKIEKEKKLIDTFMKEGKEIIAFSNSALVRKDTSFIGFRGNENNLREGNLLMGILTRDCKIPYNFLMSKEQYLKAGGYDPNIPLYEDWDFKIRLASLYEFYFTGSCGNAITIHGEGLSSTSKLRHIYWLHKIFWKNIHLLHGEKKWKAMKMIYKKLFKLSLIYLKEILQKYNKGSI